MHLHFPTSESLRLALTTGVVPEAVRLAAARFGVAADGSLWVLPETPLAKAIMSGLRKLGVKSAAKCPVELSLDAASWPQMLPLAKDPRGAQVGDKTPVLFELSGEDSLTQVVGEILRLGNDRQSYRWIEDGDDTKALLRVIGPPYYSLLLALDRDGEPGAPVAYREAAPRVWTQLGWTHPLADHLRPPPGQLLLCRPPHRWCYVPEAKFHDIYDVIDFALPHAPQTWRDTKLEQRIAVPLRLTRGGVSEGAELWLLREDGIAQLEEMVRHADDQLLARLAFAVADHDGQRVVILRARPSKLAPPVLVLDGLALRPYLRLPNLFLPVGARLHPPLRRDAVVKLLAHDAANITWLRPHDGGSFTPESVPDDAFRPLSQWIDYLFDHEAKALTTWTKSMTFDFESFVCNERGEEKEKPKPPPKPPKKAKPTASTDENAEADEERARAKRARKLDPYVEWTTAPPSEIETTLRERERQFQELTTPLDDPQRQELWRAMAQLGGALGQQGDAAICWSNGLWEDRSPQPEWPQAWYRQEAKQPATQPPTATEMVRQAAAETPTHGSLRKLAAYLQWAAASQPPADLKPNLPKLQQHLERHEHFLGVRAAWLAWHALHRLSGGDVLALARARDRLLERLHLHGLAVDLDLPLFLRTRGDSASQRVRLIREHAVRIHRLVQEWAKTGPSLDNRAQTPAYIDLVFAYGMARLGDTAECHRLLAQADAALANRDDVHEWLREAFQFRVRRALEGRPGAERLPDELLARLETMESPAYLKHMEKDELDKVKQQLRLERYKIDRIRAASRIIEPHEKVEPYRRWHGHYADELSQSLATLTDVNDRGELVERLQKLLSGKQKFKGSANAEPRILLTAMELAPRLGEAFAGGLLDRVPAVLQGMKDPVVRSLVLEKGLFLAAHFDRAGDVQAFVDRFHELLEPGAKDTPPVENLVGLLSQSVRGLRKLGRRDEVGALLDRMESLLRSDPALQDPKASAIPRGKSLALLLKLAEGKFFFGQEEQARAILDQVRETLLQRELIAAGGASSVSALPQKEVACAYLSALGQAPMELALARVMELFRRLEGISDSFTTSSHYSLSRLEVAESVVLALASDDFAMDRDARRWLDDDEFLVRRRIHRDVREAMGA